MGETTSNPFQFKLGAQTHVGCVRTNNEDNFIVSADLASGEWLLPRSQNLFTLGAKGAVLVVADGMGGLDAGEVASRIAVDTVKTCFAADQITDEVVKDEESIRRYMRNVVVAADGNIKRRSKEEKTIQAMGTTLVVAWLIGEYAYIAWCGDSRAYLFNPVSGLKQLSKDHSYVQELVDMLLSTPNMEQRTVGIGRLDPEIARDFSNVGPMVRASGHARDTRADHPFVGYGLLPMEVHSEQGCDVISRLKVRINEVYTALNMIDFGLDNLPGGPLMVEGFTYIPHRFALGFAEAPRGDDIHWSMTGDNQKLYRWRCRAATYANWPTLRYMLRGNTVSDAPLIIGSLDPCYSCTDRMTVVDVRKKKSKVVPYKELERYSIERKNSPLK